MELIMGSMFGGAELYKNYSEVSPNDHTKPLKCGGGGVVGAMGVKSVKDSCCIHFFFFFFFS